MNDRTENTDVQIVVDDTDDNNIDDVVKALTQWTRTVMQSLPPLRSVPHNNNNNNIEIENEDNEIEEEWDYEQSFPEFQSVLSDTQDALQTLLQQLVSIPGGVEDTDEDLEGVQEAGTTTAFPPPGMVSRPYSHHSDPVILYEQCRDEYEVYIQQIEAYLSFHEVPSARPMSFVPTAQADASTSIPNPTRQSMELSSPLVLQKPQDIYQMTYHYYSHHPTAQKYPRTLPFIPKIDVVPLPFHHTSSSSYPSTTGSINMMLPIQMKAGDGYDNRYGMLRSRTTTQTTTSLEGDDVPTESTLSLFQPTQYCEHLYRTEIEQLEYTDEQLSACPTKEALPPLQVVDICNSNATLPYTYVDTKEKLQQLAQIIEEHHITTIALDVEAHSVRSFSGMVCLLQMSFYLPSSSNNTIQNYIIDTLLLHDDIQRCLLPIMVNPHICKVFHGADMDIQWLQRDFSIYVVNLFDTYRAAKYINEYQHHPSTSTNAISTTTTTTRQTKLYTSLGYAGLVKHYCDYTIDKRHQLSDWRIRPLPVDMLQYAVQDTYYLITMYEYMKYDLVDQCGGSTMAISAVLDICKNVSLIRYCPPPFDPYGYRSILLSLPVASNHNNNRRRYRNKKQIHYTITTQQELLLKALWDWRDQMARQEDESVLYVCSNAQLLRIVYSIHITGSNTTTSTTTNISESYLMSIIHQSTSSSRPPPPLLMKYVSDLCQLIRTAIDGTNDDVLPPPSTMIAAKEDKNEPDADMDEDDEDDDDEDDLDDEDEEVVNSGRVDSAVSTLLNPSIQDVAHKTSTTMVGPSRTTGSAFFKPAIKSGNGGGNESAGLQRHIPITTALTTSDGEQHAMARSSPVLGTHALYEQAGWTTPRDSISQKEQLFTKHIDRQGLVATIHPPSMVTGSYDVATGIVHHENADIVLDTTKPPKLLSIHGSNQEFRSDLQLNTSKVAELGLTRVSGTHKTAPVVTVVSQASSQQKSKHGVDNVTQIIQGTATNAWKEAIPAVLGLISSADNENDVDDDDMDDDDIEDDENKGVVNPKGLTPDRRMKADMEEEFVIPRSIREIYMISNRNRRNKKAGSPTPERGSTPTTEKERLALAEAEALLLSRGDAAARYFMDEATSGKRQKQRSTKSSMGRESEETLPVYDSTMDVASKEDDFQFMKSIGWIPNSEGVTVDSFLNQRLGTTIALPSPNEQSTTKISSDNEPPPPNKQVAVDSTVANIGVIHPTSQQLWNSGNSTNPFFAGAAAQAGGPLQQQRNVGSAKSATASSSSATPTNTRGGKSSNTNYNDDSRTTGTSSNRQVERPDKKEGRSYAYRKR